MSESHRIAGLAEQAAQRGHHQHARELFAEAASLTSGDERELVRLATTALRYGVHDSARTIIDMALGAAPGSALAWATRAAILQADGDQEAAIASYQHALDADPGFLPARFDLAALLARSGRPREANHHNELALRALPADHELPPPIRDRAMIARSAIQREQAELEGLLQERLSPHRNRLSSQAQHRFDECFEILRGRRKPQLPKPGFMYFPGLPALTFYPRELFDWIERAQAATDGIRRELEVVLAQQGQRFMPYVQKATEEAGPGSAWNELNHNDDWGVYFLFNQGERVQRHCEACPQTTALLDALPLVHIPGRGPTAFFSRLRPGTHIPPHHGATNTRLVAHLPLIVPPDCTIRVGNDLHAWKPGEIVLFDDTIEHEAWNRSGQDRVVLIFDVWNPFLTEAERAMVTETTAALAEFYPQRQHDTGF